MAAFPTHVTVAGQDLLFERILKDDFFSLNILYHNQDHLRYVLKLSDFRFIFGFLFRPIAAWISKREYAMYQRVADIPGIPALGPRYGSRGYFHEYIEGKTLYQIEKEKQEALPAGFFENLGSILQAVHQRRIFYGDLNKRGNIICSMEGSPYLIDFQICVHFPLRSGWIGKLSNKIFHRLIQEDVYHLYKHKKTFQKNFMSGPEIILAQRSSLNQYYSRFIWKPYITVKRLIYPHGSNETIWYKWKRQQDQSSKVP